VILRTEWGVISLSHEVEYAVETGETIDTLRTVADELHDQATRLPEPVHDPNTDVPDTDR